MAEPHHETDTASEFPRLESPVPPAENIRWTDRTKDVAEIADRTDAGSLTITGFRTSYIEFCLEEPDGMSVACDCTECGLSFWIPAFDTPVECPRCHAPKRAIRHAETIGTVPGEPTQAADDSEVA